MTKPTDPFQPEAIEIGIITALEKEFAAVKVMLEDPRDWAAPGHGAGRRYVLGRVPTRSGQVHVVALAMLVDMGNNNAAIRATQFLAHFPNLRDFIMCGIAGGIADSRHRPDRARLGDIVVSDRNGVVQYDLIKDRPEAKRKVEFRSPPRPPSAELLEAVRFLRADALAGDRRWEPFLEKAEELEDAQRPADHLDASGNEVEYPADPKRRPGLPRIFFGPIASANRLLKSAEVRDELHADFGALAAEMEGSGIADAAWVLGQPGYLVVRGICDDCDPEKGDLWQGYAALAAAAYVRALVESMPTQTDRPSEHLSELPLPTAIDLDKEKRRLLWVEDDGPGRYAHELAQLSKAGWFVAFATNVLDAARKLANERFQVLLLDQVMPYTAGAREEVAGWGGCVLFWWLRGKGHPDPAPRTYSLRNLSSFSPHPDNKDIPVILATGFHSAETVQKIDEAANPGERIPVLAKPLLLEELLEYLHSSKNHNAAP